MTTAEIRKIAKGTVDVMAEKDTTVKGALLAAEAAKVLFLGEIAAQLSEMNLGQGIIPS